MQRPLGVTIVGILIILLAVLGLAGAIHLSVHRPLLAVPLPGDPVPPVTRHAVLFLASVLEFIAGVLVLSGWDLGRTLYAVVGALALVFAFATSPLVDPLWLRLIVFGVFLFVLYQPVSSQWFRRRQVGLLAR